MIVTVYRHVPVSADVTIDALARYLVRTGWELVQIGEWVDDVLPCFKLARWRRRHNIMTLLDNMDEQRIASVVAHLALADGREGADVLADIAGHELLDRGTAINRLATAGARLVEAREALVTAETSLRAKPKERPRQKAVETAKAGVGRAEQDVETATAALRAAEGVGA